LREVTGTTIRPGGLALTDRAVGFCSLAAGARILDVGCGAGASVEHLVSRYGFAASGVDTSRKLIAEGVTRNPSLLLAQAAAEALPFPAESQDAILCECVLSLVEEPFQALAEFRRVLRPGGHLMLSDMYDRSPKAEALAPEVASDRPLSGAAGREQLEGWVLEAGFTILLWEDHTMLLKELAASLVLAHGSLHGICCTPAGVRPGYYLLVARKTTTMGG